jgi:hypothetical protein
MRVAVLLVAVIMIMQQCFHLEGLMNVSKRVTREIEKKGPWLGLVVPNTFEMNPLLVSPSFQKFEKIPYVDIGGMARRYGYP